jgi:hypothetical protein
MPIPTSGGPTPDDYERITGEAGDLRMPPPLSELVEQHSALNLRDVLSRHRDSEPTLGMRAEPLTAEEHLTKLALSEAIARRALQFRGLEIDDAVRAGAAWPEVAAAIGVPVADAQATYRRWVEGQHHLNESSAGSGPRPGLDDRAHAEAVARLDAPEAER